jgi:protein-L-isoaspartate(D-aspartate) O-methyltransferase
MKNLKKVRDIMVEKHLKARGIQNQSVLQAMQEVAREQFVPHNMIEFAYEDSPLPIGEGQTISQPYIVAAMTEFLEPSGDDRVLEIGTGSGYAAAVLSRIVRTVYTIERHESLLNTARERFQRLGYDNIQAIHGDGTLGLPDQAPFDVILVTAGAPEVPQPLKEQLAIGGRMVVPVGPTPRLQSLVRVRRISENDFDQEELVAVRFVPLVGEAGWKNDKAEKESSSRSPVRSDSTIEIINRAAETIPSIEEAGLRPLMHRIGDARVVLLGESTHGTAEFYDMRARITRELIENHGFNIIAIEADWPDVVPLNKYIRGIKADVPVEKPFTRFPTWMWANTQFSDFVQSLRKHNEHNGFGELAVSIHGLDIYSLHKSIGYVLRYLDAVQNARLVASAEQYYRLMYHGSRESWNLRDQHMFDTLKMMLNFYGDYAKAVVWEHNSHIGNAAATEMGIRGEKNVGMLCREAFGRNAYLIGFGTDHGTVAAASDWDKPMEIMPVRPSHKESYEHLFHQSGLKSFTLPLNDPFRQDVRQTLLPSRLERAIGVVYSPQTELQSHYFH